MHPQVKRAFDLNVDPDTIQGHAAREDWDGLEAACERRVQRVNAELAKALTPKPGAPSVELMTENARLHKELELANAKLAEYDRQLASVASQLAEDREAVEEAIEEEN